MSSQTNHTRRVRLGIAVRAGVVAIVVLNGRTIIDVVRCTVRARETSTTDKHAHVINMIRALAVDYGATTIVVEPASPLLDALRRSGLHPLVMTVVEAKDRLLPKDDPHTHAVLFEHLLCDHPELARFVTLLPGRPCLAISERGKTVVLLAGALGLAFENKQTLSSSKQSNL